MNLMGRIKTQLVKRTTNQLLSRFPGQFGEDFSSNKELVNKHLSVYSSKIRNTIAGYLTRLVKIRKAKNI